MGKVIIHEEVTTDHGKRTDDVKGTGLWELCFQKVTYKSDEWSDEGFRFIWRRPNGNLQAARGQARLTLPLMFELLMKAFKAGWCN